MVQRIIKKVMVLVVIISISSCYYDAEDILYPNVTCVSDNMSYSSDISPIIVSNCFACHRNGSTITTISLEGYENLKIQVGNGALSGTINHASGYSPMPQNLSKMSDCTISKIESWISQGALNN